METSNKQIHWFRNEFLQLRQIRYRHERFETINEAIEAYTGVLVFKGLLPNGGQRPKYCRRIKWLACLAERFQDNLDRFELEFYELDNENDDGITLK